MPDKDIHPATYADQIAVLVVKLTDATVCINGKNLYYCEGQRG
jgi:hypothetical protein